MVLVQDTDYSEEEPEKGRQKKERVFNAGEIWQSIDCHKIE